MSNQIYFEGDRVYTSEKGWGVVSKYTAGLRHPVLVQFDSGLKDTYTDDGCVDHVTSIQSSLSFTKYTLVDGGFSQERPKPNIEEGQMIWVKPYDSGVWTYVKYLRHRPSGEISVYVGSNVTIIDGEISILNPYSESVEAEALNLLKYIFYRREKGRTVSIEEIAALLNRYNVPHGTRCDIG